MTHQEIIDLIHDAGPALASEQLLAAKKYGDYILELRKECGKIGHISRRDPFNTCAICGESDLSEGK